MACTDRDDIGQAGTTELDGAATTFRNSLSVCREYCCLCAAELGARQYRGSKHLCRNVSINHDLVRASFQLFLAFFYLLTLRFLLAAYANEYASTQTL